MALSTCPKCGRTMEDDWCGYCWGLEAGTKFMIEQGEAEARAARRASSGGCAVLALAAAAVPVAILVLLAAVPFA